MNTLLQRFGENLRQQKTGIFVFACAALSTIALIIYPKGVQSTPTPLTWTAPLHSITSSSNGVSISGSLSQAKVVQNRFNEVFLKLSLQTPAEEATTEKKVKRSSDFVVVLDRSGSMSSDDKLPFAKAAIGELIATLNAEDRFALVTFDNRVILEAPLTALDGAGRRRLLDKVKRIQAGGGTNISAGLSQARQVLHNEESPRIRRIILLSDGQANEGITSPEGLSGIVDRAVADNIVVSTIGLGLGFNQNLMSQLADHGMGNYAYLEHLGGLGVVLASTVKEARETYASRSEVVLNLPRGVHIKDAGGYPVRKQGTNSYIQTGLLRQDSAKSFFVTLKVPTDKVGDINLGSLGLNYWKAGERYVVAPSEKALQLAVVPSSRRKEARDSIQSSIYRENWTSNAIGIVKKKVANLVSQGRKKEAEAELSQYEQTLRSQSSASGIALEDEKVKGELAEMKSAVVDAFQGSASQQLYKQNRTGKQYQFDSLQSQRKTR